MACSQLGVVEQRLPGSQPEDPLTDRETRGAVAELDDYTGQFVAEDTWRAVAAGAVDPGPGPVRLASEEACGVSWSGGSRAGRRRSVSGAPSASADVGWPRTPGTTLTSSGRAMLRLHGNPPDF